MSEDGRLPEIINRPMIDVLSPELTSDQICFYSDASASKVLGYGCIFNTKWLQGYWNTEFIEQCKPSIEYLELFALTAGLLTWGHMIRDCRVTIFCDNSAVVSMVNDLTSSCRNCMVLLRMITLNGLKFNRRVRTKYVRSRDNGLADALSRGQMMRFRKLGPHMDEKPCIIHSDLIPM